jgi:hypothetical protein
MALDRCSECRRVGPFQSGAGSDCLGVSGGEASVAAIIRLLGAVWPSRPCPHVQCVPDGPGAIRGNDPVFRGTSVRSSPVSTRMAPAGRCQPARAERTPGRRAAKRASEVASAPRRPHGRVPSAAIVTVRRPASAPRGRRSKRATTRRSRSAVSGAVSSHQARGPRGRSAEPPPSPPEPPRPVRRPAERRVARHLAPALPTTATRAKCLVSR